MNAAPVSVATPAWLEKARELARREFASCAEPAKTAEAWRKTPFEALGLKSLGPGREPLVPAAKPKLESDGLSAYFWQDGPIGQFWLDERLAAKGVRLMSIDVAAAESPELLRAWIEQPEAAPEYRKLELANRGNARGGLLLFVPKGVRLEAPVRAVFDHSAGGFCFPQLLAILEDGAELTLIEEHRSQSEVTSIAFSRVILGKGAQARVIYQQELAPEARHFWNQRCTLAEGARLVHTTLALGGKIHKSQLDVEMGGPGAASELFGMTLGHRDQHFDAGTKQWHKAPRTSSDLLARTALRDESRSVYTGLIRIEKEAVSTDSFQANHNLLLSEKARADSTPILEILTDEVRCKHGATAGPLSKEELFYLATRGFSKEDAERTLIMGFFEPVLKRLPSAAERERLAAVIEGRL